MIIRCNLVSLTSCLLLTGCALQASAPPKREAPPAFENAGTRSGQWPAQQWYRDFGSDELDTLIDLAARTNWDLQAARARVIQADARARQAGAAILPEVAGTATGNYLAGHSSQGGGHEFDWSAMLSASYEVDFWGRNRAGAESARLLAGASRAERDTVALTTLAGVANAYFQLLAVHERLSVAQANREAAQQLLDVIKARFDVRMASPIELATQRTQFDAAQIAIADLQQAQVQERTALALLLGRAPENFEVQGQPLDSLREPAVGAGLPAELLTRRPDVMQAESNLRAADADLIAARAALLPSLSLTAGAGVASPALPATVLTIPGIGPSLALGGNLVQPIFDRGRLKAQREEVQARNLELLAAYRSSIIAAFADVEEALARLQYLDQAREFQTESLEQSEQAFQGAKLRYQAGTGDYLALLEAQRTLYAARDQLILYKLARLRALVGLCKALGGGWTAQQAQPAQNQIPPTRNVTG